MFVWWSIWVDPSGNRVLYQILHDPETIHWALTCPYRVQITWPLFSEDLYTRQTCIFGIITWLVTSNVLRIRLARYQKLATILDRHLMVVVTCLHSQEVATGNEAEGNVIHNGDMLKMPHIGSRWVHLRNQTHMQGGSRCIWTCIDIQYTPLHANITYLICFMCFWCFGRRSAALMVHGYITCPEQTEYSKKTAYYFWSLGRCETWCKHVQTALIV